MSPTFEGLPDELIDEIIGYIDQYAALVDLKRTCKRFDEFTEWALYRSVTLKDSNREQFERSLLNRPERCDRVRELSVEAESLSGCTQAPLYATLANLEVLSIKSVHSRHDERAEDVEEGDVVTLWDMDQVILQATISHASMLRPVGDRIWCHLRSCKKRF